MPHEEPWLFDLPLVQGEDEPDEDPGAQGDPELPASGPPPGEREASGGPGISRAAGAGELPLFPSAEGSSDDVALDDDAGDARYAESPSYGRETATEAGRAGATDAGVPVPASWSSRVLACLADGAFLGAAVVGGGLTAAVLGAMPGRDAALPFALFALVFSFVYSVVPLAFWGHTPGMATAGLVARDDDGGPLTFGQTGLRWLGGLLTLAFAGLPLLLALGPLGGRSLADRLSGSRTWRRLAP